MAGAGVIGRDIGRASGDGHRGGEVQFLPALADSLVKVPVASSVPVEVQSVPVCVPVLSGSL